MADEPNAQLDDDAVDPNAAASDADPKPAGHVADALAPDADADPDAQPIADDWRAQAAGGDKNLEKLVKRFGSVNGLARALADSKAQLSKREQTALADLPEDATDEAKAEWRKARNVPDTAEGYDTSIKGIDWTDDDKAALKDFTAAAHRLNVPAGTAKGLIQWYADTQVAIQQEQNLAANRQQKSTEQALRSEYGADYQRNVDLMKDFGVSQLGQETWDSLMERPFSDGTKLGDNPAFIKLIVDSALDRGDGLPMISGGASGGMSDADFIKAHQALSAKASGGGKEASEAKAKMNDPDYQKSVEAAYERQERRAEAGRRAA